MTWESWKTSVKILSAMLLLCGSFLIANKMKEAQRFPIHKVSVFGAQHIDRAQVQRLLSPLVTKNFFTVEVDGIKEQLLQMPWVSDVEVRRVWPDQVMITLAERKPTARWNDTSLISSNGEIFTPNSQTYPDNLPQLVGPEGEQIHVLQYYTKFSQLIEPLHLKITRLELTPYLTWNMMFDSGMKVTMGYKDVLTRISHFVKVYPKIVGERAAEIDYIDLRYPNGLAVRWKTIT